MTHSQYVQNPLKIAQNFKIKSQHLPKKGWHKPTSAKPHWKTSDLRPTEKIQKLSHKNDPTRPNPHHRFPPNPQRVAKHPHHPKTKQNLRAAEHNQPAVSFDALWQSALRAPTANTLPSRHFSPRHTYTPKIQQQPVSSVASRFAKFEIGNRRRGGTVSGMGRSRRNRASEAARIRRLV